MEGPSFHCAYLGFSPISKPPTSLSVLQGPIRDLYFQYRKTPATGRSVNLKLIQKGVLVTVFENGSISAELFFDFASVTFVEAAKFMPVKSSSERKPRAIFVPADESKGQFSDKIAFSLEKVFHFLVSSTHPPLVVCVVRRPAGVKALDCHVFALDTTENALHIAALIASAQMPVGQGIKGDTQGEVARVKGAFDRGIRGDVIRTDHGEYSVYRGGPQHFDQPPIQRYNGGLVSEMHQDQRYTGGPVQGPVRTANLGYPEGGPLILTQDNFRGAPHPTQQIFGGPHTSKGYISYEQPNYGNPAAGYSRPPDVIMHTHQWSNDNTAQLPHERKSVGAEPSVGGIRARYDEVQSRNNNSSNIRAPAVPAPGPVNRLSMNLVSPSSAAAPRPTEISPMYISGQQQHGEPALSPVTPMGAVNSSRPAHVFSPMSPAGFDAGGPVFSASNLESRGQRTQPDPGDRNSGVRPVAKVPPHMKGIKVLPSDFRMVKLKSKNDKRPDIPDDEDYDNDREIVEKYKEYQQKESDLNYAGGMKQSSTKPINSEVDGFRDFSEQNRIRSEERNKDFQRQWNETVTESKVAGRGYNVQGTNHPIDSNYYGGPRNYEQHQEENNNRNRSGAPAPGRDNDALDKWAQKSHPVYSTDVNRDPHVRTKDLEIANMFSNFNLQSGVNRQVVYKHPGNRSEIEDGLGYLP